MKRILTITLAIVLSAGAAMARPAVDAYYGYPPATQTENRRCTDDGRDCVRLEHYAADVCMLIERNAAQRSLDPNFLARLLWKESRFEPSAVSPAGALGIAQFIPSTAELYDLDDPFNPAQAIHKAAWYLSYLADMFGNVGLAAVAYNGGENRAARYIGMRGGLPYETEDYVASITGFEAVRWRDNPPGASDLRLGLQPDQPDMAFRPACEKMAGDRKLREFTTPQRVFPWGVIVASHPSQSGAAQQVARLNRTLRPLLGDKRVGYVRKRITGRARALFTAQVGYESRAEASSFCLQLKRAGGRCIVMRN